MNKNFELLKTLNKAEFYRFADFINSPFYNKRSDMVKLMEYLCSVYPKLDEKNLSEEVIYRKVYSEGSNNNGKHYMQVTRNLMTRLGELLDKFLMVTGVESEADYRFMPYAARLSEKNSRKKLNEHIEGSITSLYKAKSTVEYYKKYTEYLEAKDMFLSEGSNYSAKSQTLSELLENSFGYYILSLLKNSNELAAFQYVYRNKKAKVLLDTIFSTVDMEKHLQNLLVNDPELYNITAIYYYGLLSKINDPDGSVREKLKEIIYNSFGRLKKIDLMECWSLLYASYIFSMTAVANNTNVNANLEVHKINKIFVDNELIPTGSDGMINENTYHNISMQAVITRDFEWAEEFLNLYKPLLKDDVREHTYSFCMAILLFSKGEYELCISFLSRIRPDEINTNMFIRITYIKCFYELGFYDQAESALYALRTFLSQSKGMTYETKRALPAFVKYCKLMLKHRSTGKKIPDEIYLKAKNEPDLTSRKWILEKMDELKAE
jgi:hypothetical protein